ncbi:MAG: D-beta-D-heptose 7-phosphate kinase / D-beta-D-heptose 1-phosphate adenosyltransferase [Acidimicrobiia bacterium]|nr:D-beta-D-heptose 7-phosphate kinase / D-beta-D-heptose 1-phosphate adenosyltransferase [Acidimicrobiia bacterium]
MRLTVVGDVLLDRDEIGIVDRVAPDAPVPVLDSLERRDRPGGAGLAAWLAARSPEIEVTLITALGRDEPGELLRTLLEAADIQIVDLGTDGCTPEKIRVRCGQQSLLRLDRGGAPGRLGIPGRDAEAALSRADGVLVADYGRGLTASPAVRALLADVPAAKPLVWDPHPRGAPPVADCWVVTPNAVEARRFAESLQRGQDEVPGDDRHQRSPRSMLVSAAADAIRLRRGWVARAVALTRGPEGAVLAGPTGSPVLIPCHAVAGGDPCGAGDRFATALLEALCGRCTTAEAVAWAVEAATAYVADGGVSGLEPVRPAATPTSSPPAADTSSFEPALQGGTAMPLAAVARHVAETRSRGGIVVSAGGCFDLLHPGHVRLLAEAARLGDFLIVLINGDESVRRLKGPGRPIQPATDRAAVLAALDAVDMVVVFEEDTPLDALRLLRPDLFVKGGDYESTDLPEAKLMESWGGQVVVLPYVTGHSTTRLVQEATTRAR